MITNKQLSARLTQFERYIKENYKLSVEEKKRDWRTYEQRHVQRLKKAMKELEPLLNESSSCIQRINKRGKKQSLTIKQKTTILLLKRIIGKSNRPMAGMLCLFSLLSGIDVGCKTVERLYSDGGVEMCLNNMLVPTLKKKNVKKINSCGDATGYSLTIRKHYATEVEKRKDKAKEKRHLYFHSC